MRFLVITLALTVFTGTQASTQKNESEPTLLKLTEEWKPELIKIFHRVDKEGINPWNSKFIRELENLLKSLASNVTNSWNQHDWPEDLQEAYDLLLGVRNQIWEKTGLAVVHLAASVGPSSHKLRDSAYEALAFYVDPILNPVATQVETILSGLVARTQALLPKVIETQESIQSYGDHLAPYVKELREYVESIHPTVNQAEEKIILIVEAFHKHIGNPYISLIVKESEKYIPDFRAWASVRTFPRLS